MHMPIGISQTLRNSPEWITRLAEHRAATPAGSRAISSAAVIGAGVMGRGIAMANAQHGIAVTLSDTSEEAIAHGVADIQTHVDPTLIRGSQAAEELAAADLVIEAVIERLPVKRRVFKKLEPLAHEQTIFASNTSSIPVTEIAAKLARPQRFVGLHFCHPVAERMLLEIVRGEQTSDETIAVAINYARTIGKRPVVVGDSPGFVVNRLLTPYLNEALELLLEGAEVGAIESAATGFGMPVGPLTAIDAIGIDVALRAGTTIYEAFPERVVTSELLLMLFQSGQFGQKTGSGFFQYNGNVGGGTLSHSAEQLIHERRREQRAFSRDELTARLILPMLTEAELVLEAGLVASPHDIDEALIHGIGFPESTGGLLRWADGVGMATILEMLRPLRRLGPRYVAGRQIEALAAAGRGFYQ